MVMMKLTSAPIVKLHALVGNYKRLTDRPTTDGQTRASDGIIVSLPIIIYMFF